MQLKGADLITKVNMQTSEDMTEQEEAPAGRFSSWLRSTRATLLKENGAEVNCGECKACCKSSYFIHIRPEETETLVHINKKFLFAAPGLPVGNVLLGYYTNGCCPMLIDDKCSIYEYRPMTCRNYDCRVLNAAGIAAGGDDKVLINQRIQHWKFSYPTKRDHDRHSAVKAAARFLRERAECFAAGVVPNNPPQLAVLAVKVYGVFLKYDEKPGKIKCVSPDSKIVKAVMKAGEKFESRRVELSHR